MYGKCLSKETSLVKVTSVSSYVLLKETDNPVSFGTGRVDILSYMASFWRNVLK